MTDPTYIKAQTLGTALCDLMEDAENRERNLADALRVIDGDDTEDHDALIEKLRVAVETLEDARSEAEMLGGRLDTLSDGAWDVSAECEDAHYSRQTTSDLAEIALDVERGIRDHSELIEACKATTPTYVL